MIHGKNLKTSLVVVLASLAFTPATFAQSPQPAASHPAYARNYGMAGCGLGSQVMGKDGGQVFAATTNGTLWNQTFGMTFGTSNCEDSETAKMAHRMDIFVEVNKVALASDIAKGGGETLASLSTIMSCGNQSQLNSALQENFQQIFPNAEVKSNDVTDSIITVIRRDQSLVQGCKV